MGWSICWLNGWQAGRLHWLAMAGSLAGVFELVLLLVGSLAGRMVGLLLGQLVCHGCLGWPFAGEN